MALPCPPEHWPRFSVLLDQAMDMPEAARGPWLRALPAQDAALRPWLSRVLDSGAGIKTSEFLETPVLAAVPEEGFAAGDQIGPYRLEALLGEGGMGEVWRAGRADDGPHRDVALKLPHADLMAGPFRRRFHTERDVLAALSHPNIAALYDAGVSAEGHPYMALELVTGQPITSHCHDTQVPLPRRVELIRQVLGALSYAHARLIVHRDIKPANVLVTPDGAVKLLDFGIAKLLDPTQAGDGQLTQPAARLATPGYSPPEQMAGGPVTVATDLFAAGILLHELCTGQRPRPLRPGGEEVALASHVADAALARLPEGKGLARLLRGDLDAIIAKAVSVDPAQRYGSADAFARDLRRWQEGLPISARNVGRLTIAAKFVRRNRNITVLAAILALALAGGTAGIAWQAKRAEQEAARATAIKNYLTGLFDAGDPRSGGKPNDQMTARELLDAGAAHADAAFAHDPATEIDLLETLAGIYDAIDQGEQAEKLWARRLDLARALWGATDPRVVESTLQLVTSETNFMDEDKAKALLDTIRAPIFARYAADSPERARWLTARATALRITHGGREEALADEKAAIAIFEKGDLTDQTYGDALLDLQDYQYDAEDYAASLATLEKARAVEEAAHSFDKMSEITYLIDKASRVESLGRIKEADALYVQVQNEANALLGPMSGLYVQATSQRAVLLHMDGQRLRADAMFQDLLKGDLRRAAATGTETSARRNYGLELAREGRAAEGIPVLEQTLAQTRKHLRDEQNLRRTEQALGDAYDQVGRVAEARTLLKAARDEWMLYGPINGRQYMSARERYARFLLDHGDVDAAQAEFSAVVDNSPKPPFISTASSAAGLARIALLRGNKPEADKQSTRAMQMLPVVQLEYNARLRVEIWLIRAEILRALGRTQEARALAQQALSASQAYDAPGTSRIQHAQALLASL